MPISLSWFIVKVPEEHAVQVANDFACVRRQVINRINQSRDLQTAYRNWCRTPKDFLLNERAYDIDNHHEFGCAGDCWSWDMCNQYFSPPECDELFWKYMSPRIESPFKFSINDLLVHVGTFGVPANQTLFYALGHPLADQLPGLLGNCCIESAKVEQAYLCICKVMEQVNIDEAIERGAAYAYGYFDEEIVEEVIQALPTAFSKALDQNCGVLALNAAIG